MNYLNINLGAFGIIATILAIAATVVAFVMIVPERKREKLGRFGTKKARYLRTFVLFVLDLNQGPSD